MWPAALRDCGLRGETQGTRVNEKLEIRYTPMACADAGIISELYAENVGMVQRTVQTLAGPRTYELVSAHLVNRVTPPAPQGNFTLAMDPGRADGVALTLRVHLDSSATLKLGFGSGQKFDVLVSDEAGNLVHRWSDGRLFDQSRHSMVVEGSGAPGHGSRGPRPAAIPCRRG